MAGGAERFSLSGRNALVTGGSRGIGRAIAMAMAEAGARVAICSRKDYACTAAAAEIESNGGTAVSVPGNVGHEGEAERIVAATVASLGGLDILVNNAATNPQFGALVDAEDSAVDRIFEVNVQGPIRLSVAAMRAGLGGRDGGSIINVVSVNGITPEPMISAYSASKAALISITRSLAHELGPRGVRVNAIAPGLVETDFARVLIETPQFHQRVVGATALGRHGQPDEIAGAAVFLASGAASFVSGSVLVVDGGWTA